MINSYQTSDVYKYTLKHKHSGSYLTGLSSSSLLRTSLINNSNTNSSTKFFSTNSNSNSSDNNDNNDKRLKDKFAAAVEALSSLTKDPGNDAKLKLYALYKQSTAGECPQSSKPSFFDVVATAKYNSWDKLRGMAKDDAMANYISIISELTNFDKHDNLSSSSSSSSSSSLENDPDSNSHIIQQFAYPRQQKGLDKVAHHKLIKTDISGSDGVATVTLNRPSKGNAFNMLMWRELKEVFQAMNSDSSARAVILKGTSTHFSTGMDLEVFVEMNTMASRERCEGRKREALSHIIQFYQDCISSPEKAPVPVIAAISGFCIGGAIDLITACDMRYCTSDSVFSIKETDLAIVADIGTLQRLPKLIGDSQTRELAFTGRNFFGKEAEELGLVLKCFSTHDEMMAHVNRVATQIASKSPLTIRGVKKTLLHARDHSVHESLEQVKQLNAAHLYSNDL